MTKIIGTASFGRSLKSKKARRLLKQVENNMKLTVAKSSSASKNTKKDGVYTIELQQQ